MNCKNCISYRRGAGAKACLKCNKYEIIRLQSAKRRTVIYEVLPSILLEQIEDIKDRIDPMSAVRCLPDDQVAIVAMRFYGGLQVPEISGLLRLSQSTVRRRLRRALKLLKKMME